MKRLSIIILITVIGATLILSACGNETKKNKFDTSNSNAKQVIDVTQFANISSKELVDKMGKPSKTEKFNYKSLNGYTYPTTSYEYNKGVYEFLVIDDKVVSLNIRSSKYLSGKGESIKFNDKASLVKMYGIEVKTGYEEVLDTEFSLRYKNLNEKIKEIWVPIIDNGASDEIKIRYNLGYF